MKLTRRSYYYRAKETSPDKALEDRIGDICLAFPRYGYRRVTKQLQREGWPVNHKRVARIMRQKGWSCKPRKRLIRTTNSRHGFETYPNLAKDLHPVAVNQLWVADITFISGS
jgi:putative transposase